MDIEKKLSEGVAKFTYLKKDGSVRTAFGTLNPKMIPKYTEAEVDKIITLANVVLRGLSTGDMSKETGKELADGWYRLINKEYKKSDKKESEYINYYDFEKKSFRKFKKSTAVLL